MHIDPIWEDPPKGPKKGERNGEKEKKTRGNFMPFIPQKAPPSTLSTPNTSIVSEDSTTSTPGTSMTTSTPTQVKKVKSGKTDVTTLRTGQALYDAIGKRGDNLINGAKVFYNITNNPIKVIIPNRTTLTEPRSYTSPNFENFEPKVVKRKKTSTEERKEEEDITVAYDMSNLDESMMTPKKKLSGKRYDFF